MNVTITVTPQQISAALRRLAKKVEDTAVGSSRVAMYISLANGIREEADKIDALAKTKRA